MNRIVSRLDPYTDASVVVAGNLAEAEPEREGDRLWALSEETTGVKL
jgi:hypothetical protein